MDLPYFLDMARMQVKQELKNETNTLKSLRFTYAVVYLRAAALDGAQGALTSGVVQDAREAINAQLEVVAEMKGLLERLERLQQDAEVNVQKRNDLLDGLSWAME